MRTVLFLATIFGFIACGGDKGNNKKPIEDTTKKIQELSPEQKIELEVGQAIEKSLQSSGANPKLVSGFEFGMDSAAVNDHTTKMMKKGALKKIKKSSREYQYVYQMPLSAKTKADTYMAFTYKQGGLYKAVYNVKTPEGAGTADALAQTKTMLSDLYGAPAFTLPSYNSCDHFLWINGRMHVDLKCELDGVQFVFTDLKEEKPTLQFNRTQVEVSDTKHE